ncbi:rap guanine nucleotide exchange factor-like isoform X2 [Frieseomelitta varia]|uniref:rap guanine nucleotide exchange factor-like isoform X2 n=1 Tax=Frieseomelitta varia TaxID=561572 RepID=UPI001CB69165|nr:rap guanine nucleotide exchange factor-like isoform X2 [Frieseomelitta varia]
MTDYLDPHFVRALCRDPERRTLQDLQIIYYGLLGLEALRPCRDSILRGLCKIVRYERHHANHVLYYTGELATSWYILLSGSVFIDGSMFLPRSSFGKRTGGSARRPNECFVLEPSEMIVDAGVNCVTGRAWFILRYYQASTTIDAFFQEAYRH